MRSSLLLLATWLHLTAAFGLLYREVTKLGLHRDIFTKIDIPVADIDTHGNNVECSLLLIDTIPSGAFVDPYQLASLKPFGGPDFYLKDAVDLEKPEFSSAEFEIHIYCNLTKAEGSLRCQYTLPGHLRYHAISVSSNFAVVKFVNPVVALRCFHKDTNMNYHAYTGRSIRKIRELCGSNSDWLCDWTQIYVESDTEDLQLKVPIGKEEHFVIVTIGTILTTVLGCVFLIYKTLSSNVKLKIN